MRMGGAIVLHKSAPPPRFWTGDFRPMLLATLHTQSGFVFNSQTFSTNKTKQLLNVAANSI